MIFIIEGVDGVGKSTLANAIAETTKGHIIHCSYNGDWDMETYHKMVMDVAEELNLYQDVIIDRWAPSEYVYGTVFRDGPSYDVHEIIHAYTTPDVTWIYCRNDNAVENHAKNKDKRKEMYDDMTQVVNEFDDFVYKTEELNWLVYDFDKVDMNNFVKELVKG